MGGNSRKTVMPFLQPEDRTLPPIIPKAEPIAVKTPRLKPRQRPPPHFNVRAMFYFAEPIPFTRESWRGRIRACRGVGGFLPEAEVRRSRSAAHEARLRKMAPERFTVPHRIHAHLFQFK